MPTDSLIKYHGRVEATFILHRYDTPKSTLIPKIQTVIRHGIKGDRHAGARLLDVRERALLEFGLPKGIAIANHREVSLVSREELDEIATALNLPEQIQPGSLGENLLVSGIPHLTSLPVGTLLFFQKNEHTKRTAVLVVWGENTPCLGPGEVIQEEFPNQPQIASRFVKAAAGKRGLVASVYSTGFIHAGDTVVARLPDTRPYAP